MRLHISKKCIFKLCKLTYTHQKSCGICDITIINSTFIIILPMHTHTSSLTIIGVNEGVRGVVEEAQNIRVCVWGAEGRALCIGQYLEGGTALSREGGVREELWWDFLGRV